MDTGNFRNSAESAVHWMTGGRSPKNGGEKLSFREKLLAGFTLGLIVLGILSAVFAISFMNGLQNQIFLIM